MNRDQLSNRIRLWGMERNLHTADHVKQMLKLQEEIGELAQGIAKGNMEQVEDSLGDIEVVLEMISLQLQHHKIIKKSFDGCIQLAYDEIKDRKGKMIDGVFVKEDDLK